MSADSFEKRFYGGGASGVVRIEVLAPVSGRKSEYRRFIFPRDDIELMELDETHSCLITRSGIAVPVALSFDKLYDVLFQTPSIRGGKIDLTLITGAAAAAVRPLTLSAAFHPKENPKNEGGNDPYIKLMAINEDDQKKILTIKSSNIKSFEKNFHAGSLTEIYLKKAVEGMDSFNIEVHENVFKVKLAEALRDGVEFLDLMPGYKEADVKPPPRKP